jgi:hypothetical protein
MKHVFTLILIIFCQKALVFGQGRVQLEGLAIFKDPLELNSGIKLSGGNSLVTAGKNFSDNFTPSFALGIWTRGGDVLNEFSYVGKKGSLKNWKLYDTNGQLDTLATLKRIRYAFEYGFYFNILHESKRFSLFPGLAIRPVYNLYDFNSTATNNVPVKQENFGFDAAFVPRLMFRFAGNWFLDASVELATERFRREKLDSAGTWQSKNEFKWAKALSKIGIGYRFGD